MLSQFNHERRPTVPGTLHGPINQVHKSMFQAFVYAFETDKDFYTTTEDTAFGNFDDAVIITEEGKVTAIQYKHVLNPVNATPISMNNLITHGGSDKELMLHSYYKSVIEKNVNLDNSQLTLVLAMNVPISAELIPCLDDQTKSFNLAFFREEISEASFQRRIMIASILKHNNKLNHQVTDISFVFTHIKYILARNISYNDLNDLWQAFKPSTRSRHSDEEKRHLILNSISSIESGNGALTDSQWEMLLNKFLNKSVWPDSRITHYDVILADCHLEKYRVILFLQRLQIAHSEKSCADTIKAIKLKLLTRFKQGNDAVEILYHAFFHYFLEWLGSYEVKKITSTEIKALFENWQNRFVFMQRWIGVSTAYRNSLITTIDGVVIDQTGLLNQIKEFQQSNMQVLVVYGERGLGKSTAACQFLESNRIYDSDYLLLDIKAILTTMKQMPISFRDCSGCKMILLDNCEELIKSPSDYKKLENVLQETALAGIKIVLFYRVKNSVFSRSDRLLGFPKSNIVFVEMPTLNKEVVLTKFPQLFGLFQSQSLTLFTRSEPIPLQHLVCHPFYLNLLVKYCARYHRFDINFSSTENFVELVLKELLNKSQISLCRSLICKISQKQCMAFNASNSDLSALVELGIITGQEGNYEFTHKLFEEWAIRLVLAKRLKTMMESGELIDEIYQECAQILPTHLNEIYVFLGEHQKLLTYHKVKITKDQMHNGIFNNNTYFYKMLIQTDAIELILQHSALLLIQSDIDPIGALNLLLMLAKKDYIHSLLDKKETYFANTFYGCLVRSICLSPNLNFTYALFCEVLEEIDKKNPSDKKIFDYYVEKIFLDIFTSCNSVGLMSLKAKIKFLENVINSIFPEKKYRYFSEIYQALLMAANPTKFGEARTYDRSCYFTNSDIYIDHKGNCYALAGDNSEEEIKAYHYAAVKLLIGCYHWDKKIGRDYQLPDIIQIFEDNLAYTGFNDCEVATIIAAEINLDKESTAELESVLSKFPNELSDNIRKILDWRKNHANQVYELEQTALPAEEVKGLRIF